MGHTQGTGLWLAALRVRGLHEALGALPCRTATIPGDGSSAARTPALSTGDRFATIEMTNSPVVGAAAPARTCGDRGRGRLSGVPGAGDSPAGRLRTHAFSEASSSWATTRARDCPSPCGGDRGSGGQAAAGLAATVSKASPEGSSRCHQPLLRGLRQATPPLAWLPPLDTCRHQRRGLRGAQLAPGTTVTTSASQPQQPGPLGDGDPVQDPRVGMKGQCLVCLDLAPCLSI